LSYLGDVAIVLAAYARQHVKFRCTLR